MEGDPSVYHRQDVGIGQTLRMPPRMTMPRPALRHQASSFIQDHESANETRSQGQQLQITGVSPRLRQIQCNNLITRPHTYPSGALVEAAPRAVAVSTEVGAAGSAGVVALALPLASMGAAPSLDDAIRPTEDSVLFGLRIPVSGQAGGWRRTSAQGR